MVENNIAGILITPEERKDGTKKEILKGAPQKPYESALAMREHNTDSFDNKAHEWLFTELTKDSKEKILDELLNDYDQIDKRFNYLKQIDSVIKYEDDKENRNLVYNFISRINGSLQNKEIKLEEIPIEENYFDKELTIYKDILKNILYNENNNSQVYESILAGALNSAETEEESINLLYNIAHAALDSYDEETIRYTLRVLTCNTPLLSQDSNVMRNSMKGLVSEDDEIVKKSFELELFKGLQVFYLSPKEQRKALAIFKSFKNSTFLTNHINAAYKKNPKRIGKILNFIGRLGETDENGYVGFNTENVEGFPEALTLRNQGPLFELTHELIAKFAPDEDTTVVTIPNLGCYNPKVDKEKDFIEIRETISQHIKQNPFERELRDPEKASIISFLRDELKSGKQIKHLEGLRKSFQKSLKEDFRRSLSPRGNKIIITDKKLKEYGYQDLTFYNSKKMEFLEKGETMVVVNIGGPKMSFILDKDYNLLHPIRRKSLSKSLENVEHFDELFFETWIIGHLEELVCKEAEEFTRENLPPSINKEFKKGYIARVGHLRTINRLDFRPSQKQINLAMEEQEWGLTEINKRRVEAEQYPVTYVRQSRAKNSQGSKPILFYADSATKELRTNN